MGLRKSDILPAIVISVAGLLEIWGDAGREFLRYDRAAIAAGDFWRLASGHFVHLGVAHMLMNGAGLMLVWILFGRDIRTSRWLFVMILSVFAISTGFWFLDPQLRWYVGLSGLLHGMLVAGIIVAIGRRRYDAVLLGALVLGKLAWEQLAGPLPGSESTAGGNVIVNAHLYGAVSGGVAGAIIRALDRKQE
jgi:rhomboid family GlyGly-CTERM serine protease